MAPRSIYVIRFKHNVVKVGIATRPRLRLLNLQSASHSPLCLDYTATVAGDARVLEIHVHKALESRRVSGEWFGIASSRAISVITGAAETLGYALTDISPIPIPAAAAVAAASPAYKMPVQYKSSSPRLFNKLRTRTVTALMKPGRHADGGSLYLKVAGNGARSWTFLYTLNGKQREAGLGSARDIPLAAAREKAAELRSMLASGVDPLTVRRRL
jgi:hypothetical protein